MFQGIKDAVKDRFIVRAELVGAAELAAKFQSLDLAARGRARKITNHFSLKLSNKIKENAPVDRGRLRSSVQLRQYVSNDLGVVADVLVAVDYAAFIEYGTGPLGRQMHLFGGPLPEGYVHGSGGKFPPIKLILEWVKRKGITGARGESPEQIAYLIARKIARQGIAAKPFVWPAYMEIKPQWEAAMQQYVPDFVKDSGGPSSPKAIQKFDAEKFK